VKLKRETVALLLWIPISFKRQPFIKNRAIRKSLP